MKTSPRHPCFEIFSSFFKLGCLSFGGPIAHLGFFREEFVKKRRWITDPAYADLVSLCQFLPGPASSQVGFALGLQRGGIAGAFLAWTAFTLPSAVLMIGFALGLAHWGGTGEDVGWIHGLKLAAVAVVAQALWGMAATLCPDRPRAGVAIAAAALLVLAPSAIGQVAVIAMGMGLGFLLFRHQQNAGAPAGGTSGTKQQKSGWPWLAAFLTLLVGLPACAALFPNATLTFFECFYRAGSLVFGGGHVVLPLLEASTVGRGWIDPDPFLAGYGAAQALPGPLFAFAAYLGTSLDIGPGGITGGLLALFAIYVPSWLLVLGALPYWERLRRLAGARAALLGANAAVVGLLLAAFYDPIWTAAVTGPLPFAIALLAFGLLRYAKFPPWALVLLCGGAGALLL